MTGSPEPGLTRPGLVRRFVEKCGRWLPARSSGIAFAGPVAAFSLLAGIGVAALVVPLTSVPVPADLASAPTPETGPDVIPAIAALATDLTVATETAEQALPAGASTTTDEYLPEGVTRVVSTGKPGVAEITYSVTYSQGWEISRVEVATVVLTPAVDRVVAVGTLVVPERPAVVAGSNRAIGEEMAAAYGWTGVQWTCLDNLWEKESNWRHLVANPSSGAYGIPQALPADKMAAFGGDWKTNPATQIAWGLDYIAGRYGTPCYAWGKWTNRSPHWY